MARGMEMVSAQRPLVAGESVVEAVRKVEVDGETVSEGFTGTVQEIAADGSVLVDFEESEFALWMKPENLKAIDSSKALGTGYSLSDRIRHIKFWSSLSTNEKGYLTRATEDLPLDLMGGLMTPAKKLYKRKMIKIPFILVLCRMALNMTVATDLFFQGWHHQDVVFSAGWGDSKTVLTQEAVVMCEDNLKADIPKADKAAMVDVNCIKADLSRLRAFKAIAAFEFVSLAFMNLVILMTWGIYLCGCESILTRMPGVFTALPKISSKFSSICFLQFVNLSRCRSLFLQGEWRLVYTIIRRSMVPFGSCQCDDDDGALDTAADNEAKEITLWEQFVAVMGSCFVFFLCVATIGLSFQALLVKLTAIHFAAVRSFYTWNFYEWVVVGGFLNQIAGICFVDEVEVHRILLFKFGGSDSMWSWNQCRVCVEYGRLLARKIASGCIDEKEVACIVCRRLKALAILTTLDSGALQLLLLSSERETHVSRTREERSNLFERIFTQKETHQSGSYSTLIAVSRDGESDSEGDQDNQAVDCEEGGLELSRQEFVKQRLEVLRRERDAVLKDDTTSNVLSSGRLHVAAQLQAHIEDLQENTN